MKQLVTAGIALDYVPHHHTVIQQKPNKTKIKKINKCLNQNPRSLKILEDQGLKKPLVQIMANQNGQVRIYNELKPPASFKSVLVPPK